METPSSQAPFLPNDVARCEGVGSDAEGWREGCETCLRRTAKRGDRAQMMTSPPIIAFECEFLIEPDKEPCLVRNLNQQNYEPRNT